MNIDNRMEIAVAAAMAAGKLLVDNFSKISKIESKGDRDYVTNVDLLAEETIVDLIRKKFPKDNILSEEGKYQMIDAEFRWIIDPLDGTHNYIHNIKIFGTSIAVEYKGRVVGGVINMPVAGELYSAQKGEGACCNGKKIQVSKRNMEQATMIYDSSIRVNKKPMLQGLAGLVDRVFNVRMFGSSAEHLTMVAAGKAEMDIEFNDKVWDYAAGLLLVEEAGGKCTDFAGNPWTTDTEQYIASNGIVHQDILKKLHA